MKEHQKKVEQDPDFIRKKLKLNADGTPREKVFFSLVENVVMYYRYQLPVKHNWVT